VRAVVLVDRFVHHRLRVDIEANYPPDGQAVEPEPPTGDTLERRRRR